MKPKIAILGHWNQSDIPEDCLFNFTHYGYGHEKLPPMTEAGVQAITNTNDLIIIDDCMGGLFLGKQDWMQWIRGGKAKVCLWLHHVFLPEYLQPHRDHFDFIAIAHTQCLKHDERAFWIPCCVVFQSREVWKKRTISSYWDFASIARHYPNQGRNIYMDRWRECFEAWGHNVLLGECNASLIPWVYGSSKVVFNINSAGDLNMRFFEGLASGAAMLMTDCEDLHNPRFEDLQRGFWVAPRTLDEEELKASVMEMRLSRPVSQQKKILDNHMLINRYMEIAQKVL